jgi:hypothetical protein
MIDQEVLNVMARAIVHANTAFGAAGREPGWDELLQINEQGDRLASAGLDALRTAGYVVAKKPGRAVRFNFHRDRLPSSPT